DDAVVSSLDAQPCRQDRRGLPAGVAQVAVQQVGSGDGDRAGGHVLVEGHGRVAELVVADGVDRQPALGALEVGEDLGEHDEVVEVVVDGGGEDLGAGDQVDVNGVERVPEVAFEGDEVAFGLTPEAVPGENVSCQGE